MDSTSGPRPSAFAYFGSEVAVASNGLVVVGARSVVSAFLFVINETSAGNASLVLLADLIPAAGGPAIAESNFGMFLCCTGVYGVAHGVFLEIFLMFIALVVHPLPPFFLSALLGNAVAVTATGLVLVGASTTNLASFVNAGAAYLFSANVSTGSVLPLGGALLPPGINAVRSSSCSHTPPHANFSRCACLSLPLQTLAPKMVLAPPLRWQKTPFLWEHSLPTLAT